MEYISSKVLRADGRLVNMSGVFCTNNAQAPSLFSNVTLTSRRSYVETVSGNSALLHSNGIKDNLGIQTEWKRGRELVHCLYKKLQTWNTYLLENLFNSEYAKFKVSYPRSAGQ